MTRGFQNRLLFDVLVVYIVRVICCLAVQNRVAVVFIRIVVHVDKPQNLKVGYVVCALINVICIKCRRFIFVSDVLVCLQNRTFVYFT